MADPLKSYALYLPSGFVPDRQWPVLFCFDPRGRGMIPMNLIQEAAEKHQFIVASSNDFFSDSETEPSWRAMLATWNDVTSRFPVDSQRLYISGFSGGARMSWVLAESSPTPVAGIIGVGAGLPWDELHKSVDLSRMAFYGIAGERDFNYFEMLRLDELMEKTPVSHYFTSFPDRHSWPPKPLLSSALDWMQMEAIRQGILSPQTGFLEDVLEARLLRSRQLEQEQDFISAAAELADAIRQLQGLLPLERAEERLSGLKKSSDFKRQKRARDKGQRDFERDLPRLRGILANLRDPGLRAPSYDQLIHDLDIEHLLREAGRPERERRLTAQRLLESILTDTSFYIPRELQAEKEYTRMKVSLRVALHIAPKEGALWYSLGRVCALSGDTREAVEALARALELGIGVDRLASDAALKSLHEVPEFKQLLQGHSGI